MRARKLRNANHIQKFRCDSLGNNSHFELSPDVVCSCASTVDWDVPKLKALCIKTFAAPENIFSVLQSLQTAVSSFKICN